MHKPPLIMQQVDIFRERKPYFHDIVTSEVYLKEN